MKKYEVQTREGTPFEVEAMSFKVDNGAVLLFGASASVTTVIPLSNLLYINEIKS